MNTDAKIGKSYFGTGFSVRQGSSNPISTYGYNHRWGFPYFNIESKTTEEPLRMRYVNGEYKNFLTNEFMIFICQIERSGTELRTPVSVDFWITSLTGSNKTKEQVLQDVPFDSEKVGYSYEGDTGLLMVVFDSSKFIGCDSLTEFTIRVNYGSNKNTYIQKTYTTDGSNADMYGKETQTSAPSTRLRNMYWIDNNISNSSVITGPVLIQNWYDGSLETYGYRGTVSQALNKEYLDSRFFSSNLISFLQPSSYLSHISRYPSRIILIDIDNKRYYTNQYDETKGIVKYAYSQKDILKPIKQIRLEFKEKNEPDRVKEFIVAEKSEEPYLLTPINYYSPIFTIQNNIVNALTQVQNTSFELQSQINFSIAYDNYCPYIFPDTPQFELIFSNDNSIKLDNEDIYYKKNENGYIFTLKDNFKRIITRSNGQITKDGQLVKSGNYFLKIKNLKSKFYTDNPDGSLFVEVLFSHNKILVVEKEEYVILESFTNQIQYKKDGTIYDVIGNVIIPNERIKIFEYPQSLLVYSTKPINDTYNAYTGTLNSASYQIKYSFDNIHYSVVSNINKYSIENDETNIAHIISWEELAKTIFGLNYAGKEETVSIKIIPTIAVQFVQNEEQKITQISSYETNIHLGIIQNEIRFDEVKVEGTNLIIRFKNNGGDRNRFYSANDFIQSRIKKEQYFSLSREGAKESLELNLIGEDSTLSFSIKELKIDDQVIVTPEQLIILFEENKNNIVSLDLLELFDTKVSEFFTANRGKTIKIEGSYCYTYTTEEGAIYKRTLLLIETFNFSISSGLSVLGLREGGIIIKPKINEPLEPGTAEKIYLRTVKPQDNSNNYAGKGIRIIAEDPTGEEVDECSIEYRKNDNENGFYLNGIKFPEVEQAQEDINSLNTTINNSSTGLVKKVKNLEDTVGNSSGGLVNKVDQNTTDITNLKGLSKISFYTGANTTDITAKKNDYTLTSIAISTDDNLSSANFIGAVEFNGHRVSGHINYVPVNNKNDNTPHKGIYYDSSSQQIVVDIILQNNTVSNWTFYAGELRVKVIAIY